MRGTTASDPHQSPGAVITWIAAVALALSFAFAYPWAAIPYFAIDFTVYFAAARALGHGLTPYDAAVLARFAPAGTINAVLSYSYPPLLAQLLVPLTVLPLDAAARLWTAFNLLAPGMAVTFLASAMRWRARPLAWAILIMGATLFLPGVYAYLSGQAALWSLACISLSLWCLRREKPVIGGVLAGLALVKLHPLLLIPIALWLRDRKALVAWGVVTFASLILAAPILGGLPQALMGAFSANNVSADEVLYQATPILYPAGATLGIVTRLLVLTVAVVLILWLHYRRTGWSRFWAAAVAVGLLAAPYLGRSDVVLAVIPLALILLEKGGKRGPKMLALLAWSVPLLAVVVYSATPLDMALLPRVWGGVTLWITALAAFWFVLEAPGEPPSAPASERPADGSRQSPIANG